MSYDSFRQVLMNSGEEGRAEDFNRLQRQLLLEIREMGLLPKITDAMHDAAVLTNRADPRANNAILQGDSQPLDVAFCPFPNAAYVSPGLAANQLLITTGPLVQMLNRSQPLDPDDPFILPFWTDGTETLATAVGHATLGRIDLVEMKLELESGASETRVYSQEGVKAILDLDPTMTNVDTIIQARIPGLGGNSISIEFVADGAGVGSLTQAGNALTFHFAAGVTTVGNFESAVAASSLIEINTVGTAGFFASPGDVEPAVLLADGADPILVGTSLNKAHRVKATFQIKAGTPNATPAFPAPTAGYVAVGAVFVAATHDAVHSALSIYDMRFPLGGVRTYDVMYNNLIPVTANLTLDHASLTYDVTGVATLRAICPNADGLGRVLAVAVLGDANVPGVFECLLQRAEMDGTVDFTTLADLADVGSEIANSFQLSWALLGDIMDEMAAQLGSSTRAASTMVGLPLWTDGTFAGPLLTLNYDGTSPITSINKLVAALTTDNGAIVHMVRFVVAHGMG